MEKLQFSQENAQKYEEMRRNFAMLCEAHEELQQKFEENARKQQLSQEWEATLATISAKIQEISAENAVLLQERAELLQKLQELAHFPAENEDLRRNRDNDARIIEKMRDELRETAEICENLRESQKNQEISLRESLRTQEIASKLRQNELEAQFSAKNKEIVEKLQEEVREETRKLQENAQKLEGELTKVRFFAVFC